MPAWALMKNKQAISKEQEISEFLFGERSTEQRLRNLRFPEVYMKMN